jgi:pyruvate,water dikinase
MDRLRQAATEPQHAAALGDYLARFGAESPVWDVARPTYREDPSPLLAWLGSDGRRTPEPDPSAWARAARDVDARLPDGQRATFAALLARARQAVALGEEDDFVYARVQAAVRAALVALGKRLAAHGLLDDAGDVFWLPLDTARALARGDAGAGTLRRLVAAARDEQQRALASPPPSIEPLPRDGRAVDRPTGHAVVGKTGSGGRAIGRVWLYANVPAGVTARSSGAPDATTPPAELPIIVAPTLLPTELPLLPAAALVVETGGVLGHVAAQARERGIPAIVGAAGACAAFATGDLVLVDGDAGVAVKLGDGDRGDSLYGDAPTR